MSVAVAGSTKVCPGCDKEFEPNHPTRTYCFECSPPGKWLGSPLAAVPDAPSPKISGKPFTVAHFRAWSKGFKLKDGKPFKLDPYQALFLEDLFARTDGAATYAELWLVVPEGNGKTTFVALIVLYTIEFKAESWVPVAASARDQAVDLTYRIAAGFIERNEREGDFRLHPGYRQIVHRESRGAAKIFASDAASGDGVDPDLAVIEELHRLASMDLYETWAGKLDKSGGQLVIVSTAGEPGGPFEELREHIRQSATETTRDGCFLRAVAPGVVLHEYAIPEDGDPNDLELVAAANPFTAKTVEALTKKRAKPSWTLSHWRRFTCNLPTRSDDAAITEAEWARQAAPTEIPAKVPIWCGADFGWKNDTTGIVPLWIKSREWRQFGEARIIEPPADGSMTHPDAIKAAFYEIRERNPIEVVVMDMRSAEDIAAWLEDELGISVVDRQQGNTLKVLDYERFMEALRQQWLWHSGDEGLRRHALNAVARVLPQGDIRFARPKESRKVSEAARRRRVIDALDAAAMVHTSATAEFYEPAEEEWEPMVAIG